MGTLLVTEEMLKVKSDIELVNTDFETMFNDINTNLDSISLNWIGNKSKIVLAPIDGIKAKNTEILIRIKAKAEEIKNAYETYMKNADTNIVVSPAISPVVSQAIPGVDATLPQQTPSNDKTVDSEKSTMPKETIPISIKPDQTTKLGEVITPNTTNIDFYRDKNGDIIKWGNTNLYPVKSGNGVKYLLYLGGRSPNEPIPSNMQIVLGLHGAGETANSSSYSEFNKLKNNYFGKYFSDVNCKEDVIAIIPQISSGSAYNIGTLDELNKIYLDVKNTYSAREGVDLSGMSQGGQEAISFVANYPQSVSTATIIAAGPIPNMTMFNYNERQLENLKKSNMLFVVGKNDSKQYGRAINLYSNLTGKTSLDYSVSKNDSILDIAIKHKNNGGIEFVEVYDASHNTWSLSTSAVIQKYN